jgi:AmmeMemoRadiSam system protein B
MTVRDPDARLPALRAIEVVPCTGDDGEPAFVLRDPLQLAGQTVAVSAVGCFILAHLDGQHTHAELRSLFRQHTNMSLPDEPIVRLLEALDTALLLDNERARDALAARCAAYEAAATRDNCDQFPPGEELRAELEKIVERGRTAANPGAAEGLRGLIAPHLDVARGAPCYAAAYGLLAVAPAADRYVVLGTNHAGLSRGAVATRKPFRTPLGVVPVDVDFIAGLARRLGRGGAADLCHHESDHAREHSIELQVHFLQVIARDRPFQLVPVLCPDVCGPTGVAPSDGMGPDLAEFADALAAEMSAAPGRTILVAGADLSHVGQRFGDPQETTPEFLADVERADRELLDLLAGNALDEYLGRLQRQENATRVCSTGCLYALRRALPGGPCRLLHYHQAVDMETETHVTCAAAAVF